MKKVRYFLYPILILTTLLLGCLLFVGCNNTNNTLPKKSQVYTLQQDMAVTAEAPFILSGENINLTLDLNGHTIVLTGGTPIQVLNGARLTIIDSNKNTTHYLSYNQKTQCYSTYSKTRPNGTEVTALPTNRANTFITVRGGLITGGSGNIHGGAISIFNSKQNDASVQIPSPVVEMLGGTIAGNSSNGYGGGVYVGATAKFTLNGGNILGNYSSSYGGAIATMANGHINLISGTIAHNYANRSGGAVYLRGVNYLKATTLNISNNTNILYNQAYHGGAVGGIVSNVTMQGGIVQGNTAVQGGGFDLYASCLTITGGNITHNTAQTKGGAILFASTEQNWEYTNANNQKDAGLHLVKITGGTITQNQAAYGGGISLSNVVLESTRQMFDLLSNNNISSAESGGVSVAKAEMTEIKEIRASGNYGLSIWLGILIGTVIVTAIVLCVIFALRAKRNYFNGTK